MTLFDDQFPDCAGADRLVLQVQAKGLALPPGEYGFFERYCEDPHCDCRRALLQVISPQRPGEILATINFGWESAAFYTSWMHGDAKAGREITSASLDPINPNSELAGALLEAFRDHVRRTPACPQRLRRHYELFKSKLTPRELAPEAQKVLTVTHILFLFQNLPKKGDFAPYRAALLAAAEQRENITPHLIAAIDRAAANPEHYLAHGEDSLHLVAIYLLAQFRETGALDGFLRFFTLPGEQALDLTGDLMTENGAAVLVSVCGDDPAPLLRLARDETVNQFVRGQAIDGLVIQHAWGERPRQAVIADLRSLFSTLAKPGDPYVWAALVGAVNDFSALELLPEVRQAFAENLVDECCIALEDIDSDAAPRPGNFLRPPPEELYKGLCERNAPIDAINECSTWNCFFNEDDDWVPPDDDEGDGEDFEDVLMGAYDDVIDLKPQPYIAPPKVGRNEPCPCGSGKKYKKCCGK